MFGLMGKYITEVLCTNYFAITAAKTLKRKALAMLSIIVVIMYTIERRLISSLSLTALLLSLTACGVEEKKTTEEQAPSKSEKTRFQPAMALASKDDLPSCVNSRRNNLVYVIDEKTFYVCDGDWQEIDIIYEQKIKAGDSVFSSVYWEDVKTGRYWYVFHTPETPGRQTCPGAAAWFEEPTVDQVREVLTNGIFEGVNTRVWIDNFDSSKYVFSDFPDVDSRGATERAFKLCLVKK